MNYNVIAIELY